MIRERKKASEALRAFLERITHRTGVERVNAIDAVGRVIAEDIYSKVDLPPFDRAAMDGYAVRAEDTFGAEEENPASLKVVGEVETGRKPDVSVGRNEAVRISTGAMMPSGANAVVMVEYTSESDGFVEVYRGVAPMENVSRAGEDVKAGELVLKRGEVIQPHDVGLLYATGIREVTVSSKVRVAVASTGDEITDTLRESKQKIIPDANRPAIISYLRSIGCEVVDLGVIRDSEKAMEEAVEKAIKNDLAIFTGATSAGKKDLMPEVVSRFGDVVVHGIAIKPGMPTALGVVNGKPVVLLPGFPVACMVAFRLFAVPAVWWLQNTRVIAYPGEVVKAKLERRIPSRAGTRTFTRVRLKSTPSGYVAIPMRTSGSGILSSLVRAHGIVEVSEEVEGIEGGEVVDVRLTRHLVEVSYEGVQKAHNCGES